MYINSNLIFDEVKNIRRELHMYPEKGFSEHRTSKYIADFLRGLNIDTITGAAGTGVIGVIKGTEGNNSIAVRSDMDCLEVLEQTGADYCSKTTGLMHACGHDGHMAALLGLAKHIASTPVKYKNNIVLIFQPAEEGPGGARLIVESGVLDKFNIKSFLSMHIFPEIEQGLIGCCQGPITARNGEVDIEITGKSGHGALPHTGIDSIVVSSLIVQAIQTILTRRIDPRENAVITLGKIYGGEARNIISGRVVMEGTIRAFSEEVYNAIKYNIGIICDGIGKANNCKVNAEIRDMYPEVYNDEQLFDVLIEAGGKENVEIIKPLMIAEDFSYYRRIAPEIMFLLGSRNSGLDFIYPLHNSKFNFDEDILVKAITIYKSMIEILDSKF